ncbi:hypothetical protein BCR34DRAFT_311485 [Clohesyomyces aquaticus]|uniref:TPR-like protein n=1 Tax=Clohesyomyces aquaticus TaxID=1231657 RepID=A0A1Y1ZP77_9PLEO|nr:hypothetical protein BCR34DRAFT_311485 [Clohesyomyces aquaticus]
MRRQLDSIRNSLELCLSGIRTVPVASDVSQPGSPISVDSEVNEWSDGSSEVSLASGIDTMTSFSEMPEYGQPFPNFAAKFERGLKLGRANGPHGEAIKRRIAQLNAANSSSIGATISKTARPTSSEASQSNGENPVTDKIRTLAQTLASREVKAPGIWSKESAAAAQTLARAYQEADDFESAFEYYFLALIAREALLGLTHLITITTMDLIAGVLELQSRWQEALDYYQLSLDSRASNPSIGMTHPTYLPIAVRIGRMYSKTGEPETALRQYASVLEQYSMMPGGGGEAAIAVRAEVAKVRLQSGDFSQASQEAEESIDEYERLLEKRTANPIFHSGHKLVVEARAALQSVKEALEAGRLAHGGPPTQSPMPTASGSEVGSSPNPETIIGDPFEGSGTSSTILSAAWSSDIAAYEAKLIQAQKANGNNHPKTLELMYSLAGAYASHEQWESAISWYHEALRGQKKTFGETHPTTLATLHNLGICYASMKDNASALKFLQEALTGRRSRLPQNHPDTLISIIQLAVVFQALKEFKEAIQLIGEAVMSCTARYGAKHPKTLSTEFRRARILHEKGDLEASRAVHEAVLRDREAMHPRTPNHPEILASKSQLGLVYRDQKDYDRAIATLESTHQGQTLTFGSLNSITTGTALDLAAIYWETEKWQKALDYYLLVLQGIWSEHNSGPTAGSVMMHNIGMCYTQLENHEEALSWFMKVLKLYEAEFGRYHEKTIGTLTQVAHRCFSCDKFDEAIGHYHRVLTAKEKSVQDSDETMMLVLFQLFRCTLNNGQNEKAFYWGKRFVAIGEETDLERRLVVKRGMGKIHAQKKEYAEALELYHEILANAEFLGQDHWLPSNIVNDMHRLYQDRDSDLDAIQALAKQRELISQLLISNPKAGASILSELGYVHARQHMHHEALSLLEEALDAIQCMPPDSEANSLKLMTLSGIADAHIELYNNEEARTYLSILIQSDESGDWKLSGMIRMAGALEKDGLFEQAKDVWMQIRDAEKRLSGFGSINLLCTERKIGSLFLRTGQTEEALRWVDAALVGFRCCNDPDAKVQATSTLSLQSSIYHELGDLENALRTQQQCVNGLETTVGESDKKTLDASLDLADIYATLGRGREALEWYDKAIAGYKSKVSDCDVRVLNAEQCRRELRRKAMVGEV